MKSLIIVTLVAAVFSAHSIAATDHDAHGGHGAIRAENRQAGWQSHGVPGGAAQLEN